MLSEAGHAGGVHHLSEGDDLGDREALLLQRRLNLPANEANAHAMPAETAALRHFELDAEARRGHGKRQGKCQAGASDTPRYVWFVRILQ